MEKLYRLLESGYHKNFDLLEGMIEERLYTALLLTVPQDFFYEPFSE